MNPNLDHDVNALWSLLLQIIADAEKRLAAHMIAHHLTPPQFFVLKTLVEHGGRCPIGQIAREHHLTNATLTGLVKRLEAVNPPLVKREPNTADRRSVYVLLTQAGADRFRDVQTGFLEQVRLILSLLSPEERQDVLEKVNRYVKIVMEMFPVNAAQSDQG